MLVFYLTLLQQKNDHYFFTVKTEQDDWTRNPLQLMLQCQRKKYLCLLENYFLELRNNRTRRLKFNEVPLDKVWISVREEYKQVLNATIEILLQFCITYWCEQSFSSLLLIKNNIKSSLKEVDGELGLALTNIEPTTQRSCSLKQAQVSH